MNHRCITRTALSLGLASGIVAPGIVAQVWATEFNPDVSLILDGHYQSEHSALSEKNKGFGLGHTEVSISSAVDDLFFGKLTTVVHSHNTKTEVEAEEAFIQTLSLPAGLSFRAGRFLSDFGYLNSQHTHTDAFTERPAVYRALLGSHYFDDGVRLSYVMPTRFYWNVGAEAFSGQKMQASHVNDPTSVGVYNVFTKVGGDLNDEHSWQLGFSYLRNENGITPWEPAQHHHDHAHEHHHHEHTHHAHSHHEHDDHCHQAAYTGKHLYGVEGVWKWAPDGNYKYRNLSLSAEYLQVRDITSDSIRNKKDNRHDGWYLSSVYQFAPQWTTGVRYGELHTDPFDDSHTEKGTLKETELMLSWNHSHFSTIRLQWTRQSGKGFEHIQDNIFTLQYIMSIGAHDAHQY